MVTGPDIDQTAERFTEAVVEAYSICSRERLPYQADAQMTRRFCNAVGRCLESRTAKAFFPQGQSDTSAEENTSAEEESMVPSEGAYIEFLNDLVMCFRRGDSMSDFYAGSEKAAEGN